MAVVALGVSASQVGLRYQVILCRKRAARNRKTNTSTVDSCFSAHIDHGMQQISTPQHLFYAVTVQGGVSHLISESVDGVVWVGDASCSKAKAKSPETQFRVECC